MEIEFFAGLQKEIRIFDVSQPGRDCEKRITATKVKNKIEGQPGIISCIADCPDGSGLYALGSYAGTVGIYTDSNGECLTLLESHSQGVTQVQFSPNGNYLFAGGRKNNFIYGWDVRYIGEAVEPIYTIEREVTTNQRIYFDINFYGNYLITGTQNGKIQVHDLMNSGKAVCEIIGHQDTVNGVSFHPTLPLIASCSGQRHFSVAPDSYDSDQEEQSNLPATKDLNELIVWQYADEMLPTFYDMQRQYQEYYYSQENLQTTEQQQQQTEITYNSEVEIITASLSNVLKEPENTESVKKIEY